MAYRERKIPRALDSYGDPLEIRPTQVIVIGMGRTGTFSLQKALTLLGYKTAHLFEQIDDRTMSIDVITEGLMAKYRGVGEGYQRRDFDKWFADYDALTDIPSYFLPEIVRAYPDAKYILTTRDSQAWIRSINATIRPNLIKSQQLPARLLAYIDPDHRMMSQLAKMIAHSIWGGKSIYDDEAAIAVFEKHNETARRLIPPSQLLELRIEDGFSWDKICPFLGDHTRTDVLPFPHVNTEEEFHYMSNMISRAVFTWFFIKNISGLIVIGLIIMAARWLCI